MQDEPGHCKLRAVALCGLWPLHDGSTSEAGLVAHPARTGKLALKVLQIVMGR